LGQQNGVQQAAVQAAQRAVEITLNEYQAGTVAYTIVITAQATLLTDQENALQVQEGRLIASVALVQALGGGWDTSQLPTHHQINFLRKPVRPMLAFSGTRDKANTAVLAPVTFLNSPVSPLSFQAFCYSRFDSGRFLRFP
jgi:hypothetical protein